MASTMVRNHRTVRVVAVVLYVVSALFLLGGIVAAVASAGHGLGAGWGPGWRGWLPISVLAAGVINAVFFLVLGSILFFLASIESNMSVMRARLQAGREPARRDAAALAAPATSQAMEAAQAAPPPGSGIDALSAGLPPEPGPAEGAATQPAPDEPRASLPMFDAAPSRAGEIISSGAPTADAAEPAEATPAEETSVTGPEAPALPQVEIGEYDEWDDDEEDAGALPGGPAAARPFPGAGDAARMAAEMEAMRKEQQWQEALELRARDGRRCGQGSSRWQTGASGRTGPGRARCLVHGAGARRAASRRYRHRATRCG